ncbi:glycosyltransferase family protein [Rhizobium halophilum]|uniref:glycosyl transferase n=1 Tax=Rhizobium halophilum TaxID=2846852 RepID=UPI001EFC3E44|nr:glycosyl transferase [Rhizobium halophilum]MCF6369788.1 glycosyl transferase [Rhizobium halophilum]
MLTVLMECHDQESELAQTLMVLVSAAVEGLVRDVVVLDNGSADASSRVADAAGCSFYADWKIGEVLQTVRGDWVLLLEAGARPQAGWVEEVAEYVAVNRQPARFSLLRHHRRPLLQRLISRASPLEHGLLLPKNKAQTLVQQGMDLNALSRAARAVTLRSGIIPARFARSAASACR